MINLPNKFSNTGKYENIINRIIDYCRSITPIDSPTARVSGSTRGVILKAAAQSSIPSASPVSIGVHSYFFSRSYLNYTLCTDSNGLHFRIAKDYKLRNLITGEAIYGVFVSYTYPHNVNGVDSLYGVYRNASIQSGGNENQGIVPQYLIGDSITCIDVPASVSNIQVEPLDLSQNPSDPIVSGTPITLLEISPRAWARFANQQF